MTDLEEKRRTCPKIYSDTLRITIIDNHLYSQLAFPTVVRRLLGYMTVQVKCRTELANGQVVALLYCLSIL
jgi:hypothetical protein